MLHQQPCETPYGWQARLLEDGRVVQAVGYFDSKLQAERQGEQMLHKEEKRRGKWTGYE